MGKKIIRVVVILMVLVTLGWVVAYSTSITLQRKYDARSYGNFLLKQEEEQLKKNYPIDKIKYSWSLWANPQGQDNDAWGAYPPDNSFICSIHIYELNEAIPKTTRSAFLNKKNYYLSNGYHGLKKQETKFGSQWYLLSEFNIDYFKPYLDTRYAPFNGEFKACIESFLNKNKSQREPVVIPNSVLNKISEYSLHGTYYYGHQDYPSINLFKNRSDYLSILFNSNTKIRFEGNCWVGAIKKMTEDNINTTKFYIYDEKAFTFSVIQIREVLNLKACQS
jgi:hypothetical protein